MTLPAIQLQRRRWLTRAMALSTASSLGCLARAQPPDDARFGALERPALRVRQPEKSVLLAAATAGARMVAAGERGLILLSDDEGRAWRQAHQVPTSVTLTALRFVDAQAGFAVGHGGVILATQDGGETWSLQADGRRLALQAKAAADARAAAGDARAAQLQKEAALLETDGPDKPLLDVHFTDARRGVVVGAYNLFFETTDAGKTWRSGLARLDNPKALHLYAVRSRGDTWLIAGEQGLLLRSTDGGRSFQRLPSPYTGSWFALAVTPHGGWVVAGLRGHAYHSSDDGEHWTRLDGAPAASFVSATALPDGSVLLANQTGQLFSARDGAQLAPLAAPSLPPLSQVTVLPGGDLLALGVAGTIRIPGRKA